ncbi:MAG: exopolysaccharide biosynthesis polyprenyl glycosylphosphotransferase [Gemmatimonadaceae bacterium]|nr:exopolysaccharide biosynthesis polyprenyl glycosylphosphotransferase [Gemmatimonadaceae bacterium]
MSPESGSTHAVRGPEYDGVPLPEVLHARAPHAVWRHVWRSVLRVLVLVAVDLVTLEVMRILLSAARDHAWFGARVASEVAAVVPAGTVPALPLQVAVLLGLALCGGYVGGARKRHVRSVAMGAMLGVLMAAWTDLFTPPALARLASVTFVGLAIAVTLVAVRFALDLVVARLRPRRSRALRAILVAPSRDLRAGRTNPAFADPTEFRFVGEVATTEIEQAAGPLGPTSAMMRLIDENRADTVVLFGHLSEPLAERLARVADAAGCNVVCLPRTVVLHGFEPQLVFHHGDPLMRLVRPGERGRQLVVKRAMDLVIALLLLVALAPLFLLIAVAVRVTSRGPALFRQVRVGQGGRHFHMWKFRSMVASAAEQQAGLQDRNVYGEEPLFKIAHDPRITRLGTFLRRTSLDELPQFWNVLRGDMSLVGPRPPLPDEVARYAERHFVRLDVRPGLTGPWQVSGRNRIIHFEDVVALETAYIADWSFARDAGILLRTLPAVIRMDGAL